MSIFSRSDYKYLVSHLCLVPSLVQQLASLKNAKKVNLSLLAFISCGGAYPPDSLTTKLISMGPENMGIQEGEDAHCDYI